LNAALQSLFRFVVGAKLTLRARFQKLGNAPIRAETKLAVLR
jgi:hypothetical protein